MGYRDADELKQNREAELIVHLKQRITQFCTAASDEINECPLVLDRVIVEPGKAARIVSDIMPTPAPTDALVMGSRGHGLVKDVLAKKVDGVGR